MILSPPPANRSKVDEGVLWKGWGPSQTLPETILVLEQVPCQVFPTLRGFCMADLQAHTKNAIYL